MGMLCAKPFSEGVPPCLGGLRMAYAPGLTVSGAAMSTAEATIDKGEGLPSCCRLTCPLQCREAPRSKQRQAVTGKQRQAVTGAALC